VGAKIGKTSQRDGPEAGNFRTERRGQRTLKGKTKPHERRLADLLALKRRAAIGRAGDEGLPRVL